MGVDDGRDSVGCVVKSVDEFKAESDQQCQGEQAVRRVTGDGCGVEITGYVEDDVDDASCEHGKECKNAGLAGLALQFAVEE